MMKKILFALILFLPFILFSGCIHGDYLNIEIPGDITIRYSDDHNYDCTYFNPIVYKDTKETVTGYFTVDTTSNNTLVMFGYVSYVVPDSYSTHTNRRDYTFVLVDDNRNSYSFTKDTYAGEYGYDAYCSNSFILEGTFDATCGGEDNCTHTLVVSNCIFKRETF